jgi:ribosomal protein L11 methyltransferase
MNLCQLECPVPLERAEELSVLLEEDALSVSWYETAQDKWALQVVYCPTEESLLNQKVRNFFENKGLDSPSLSMGPLPQEDWVASVYRDFPPLSIGRFYIYGSHIAEAAPNGLIPIQIDAATAFGSGQHESTEGCLMALSLLTDHTSFLRPLDMGCGSGILALAMASLWKVPVVACDNDPEAVRVAAENAKLNHLESLIKAQVSEGFAEIKQCQYDVITANILAGPLCQMAGQAMQVLEPGGYIILAGLLNRQAEDVIDAYRSVGAKLVEQLFIEDWSTLIMRKENNG